MNLIKKLANAHCFNGVSKVKMSIDTLKSTLTFESDMYITMYMAINSELI